jgi:hypothetical protein
MLIHRFSTAFSLGDTATQVQLIASQFLVLGQANTRSLLATMSGARLDKKCSLEDAVYTGEAIVSRLEHGSRPGLHSQATGHSVKNIVSPITRLPTEVLTMIFTTRPRNWKRTRHQELTLRLVSRRWHDIVDSTPQLWTTVGFSLSSWSKDDDPAISEQRLIFRLEKSKTSPLDVRIDLKEGDLYSTWDDDEHDSINSASDHPRVPLDRHLLLLVPHAHRFYSLKIMSAWYSALSQTLEPFLAATAPLVEKITIQYHRPLCWDYKEESCLSFFVDGAPSLRGIKLDNLSLTECSPPLTSVTHLTLSMHKDVGELEDFDSYSSVFSELTSLIWLRIEGMVFENYEEDYPPIDIPTLKHLDIRSGDAPGLDSSIACFNLPTLNSLLVHDAADSFDLINSTSNGAAPKFPTVRELDLYQRPAYSWQKQVRLLSRDLAYNFPNLESLTLFCDDNDHLSPEVAFIRDNVDCFLSLETLDLRSGPKDEDLLLSMIRQRVASGRPIIRCGFSFDYAGGVTEQMDYLENELPSDYELDDVTPAFIYIGNLVSKYLFRSDVSWN